MKKGQITIFIILGIILLLLVGISIYVFQRVSKERLESAKLVSLEPATVTDYVSSCLRITARDGIYLLASQGGYINPLGDPKYGDQGDYQRLHYALEEGPIPYVVDGKQTRLRPLEDMTQALSRYVAVELKNCMNFSAFEEQGWTIQQPDIDWQSIGFNFNKATIPYSAETVQVATTARLDAGDVVVRATYPLHFNRDGQSFTVSQFSTTLPYRLALLQKIAASLTANIARNEKGYRLQEDCSKYAASDRLLNIYTTIAPYALDHAVRIVDAQPVKPGDVPLRFQFAVKNVNLAGECIG